MMRLRYSCVIIVLLLFAYRMRIIFILCHYCVIIALILYDYCFGYCARIPSLL